jgi:tRNA U34 5-methylaminomethyl-2-thiouridine-forming methyltransferase MnmC
MMKREIFITQDHSHSINIVDTNITYHSKYGAIQESKHIYINAGLKHLLNKKSCINIFEMGFGTGLNALLALAAAEDSSQKIYYETVEAFPLEKKFFEKLNYCKQLQNPGLQSSFLKLHNCGWQKEIFINPFFDFKKINTSFQNYIFDKPFDIIFYDAFAPRAQPELWSTEIFIKLFDALSQNGSLVTYCSKGDAQRAMQAAGFVVQKLPGPLYKREILRALKK